MARMETHCFFAASDAEAAMSAVYLGQGSQHHDITTVVSHEMRDCASRQLIAAYLMTKRVACFRGVCVCT